MCAPSPPAAPDYAGAAQQQGAANIEAAKVQGKINNPNVYSPYGTQVVTWAGDQPTLNQQFSPEQQAIFDASNKNKLGLNELAGQGTDALKGVVGTGVNFGDIPSAPTSGGVNQRVIDSMMGRVNEDYKKSTDETNSQLVAAGIRPGTKAYDDRMQLLQRGKNDAAQQAVLAGYQQGNTQFGQETQARKDAIAEYLSKRQIPLNEITALMSGSQVNNPFAMPGYAQNSQVAPAPLFGATQQKAAWDQGLYNVGAAGAGNIQSGLFGLGGALLAGGK
jgi:hypothetical protein